MINMSVRRFVGGAACVTAALLAMPAAAHAASSGTFAPPQYLPTGTFGTNAVAVADVTGDGRPDLLAGLDSEDNTKTNALAVFAQRGDRTYGTPVTIAAHGNRNEDVRLATGDLDRDGRTDVAMTTSDGVELFYQRNGRLQAPVLVAARSGDVELADLTGDGRLDLVVSAGKGTVRIYPQSSTGTFSAGPAVTGPFKDGVPTEQVLVADFNGDRRPDLAQEYGWGAWVRLRNADGSWGAAVTYQVTDTSGDVVTSHGATAGDVTGDGRADLVLTGGGNRPWAAVNVFVQRSTGGLAATAVRYAAYDIPADVAVADLTGDGRGDLVTANSQWRAISVSLQQAGGTLGAYTTTEVDAVSSQADALAVADVTGDGKPDIVSVSYTKLAILRQQ
jgi:hypothetical protein